MEFAFNRLLTADDSYQMSNFGAISMRSLIEWKPYLWVSLGGILGVNLRYFLSRIITRFSDAAFPYGTLLINITGSLVLGILFGLDHGTRVRRSAMAFAGGHRLLRLVHNVFELRI